MKKRVAITDDRQSLRCRLLIKLIEYGGGEPVLIPILLPQNDQNREVLLNAHLDVVRTKLATCQAVIIPGNALDIHPSAYGDSFVHPETEKKLSTDMHDVRFETECALVKNCLQRQLPFVGICGGMQLINVVLGGTLVQHLADDQRVKRFNIQHKDDRVAGISPEMKHAWEEDYLHHIAANNPSLYHATHQLEIVPDSLLGCIYETKGDDVKKIGELSIHHQGCFPENLSSLLRPIAFSPDGLVEAAQMREYPTMGLVTQFHWECNVSGIAKQIMSLLLKSVV